MTTPDPSPPQRAPWYRSPWPMLILAVAAAVALVVGLALRFLADPRPEEAVNDLRQFALIFGMAALIIAGYATTTKAQDVPSFGRGLVLRVFPRIEEQPAEVTPAAARWTPISRGFSMFAWAGAAIWYLVALIGWLIARVI